MWIANLLRGLADVAEGKSPRDARKYREKAENFLQLVSNLDNCKEVLDKLASQKQLTDDQRLSKQDYLDLRLKEYETLRSEQRTRLDAANRLIHYNVLVMAAVIAGLLTGYKKDNMNEFNNALENALLLLPLLSMPFTFTQWNDEIIVDNIGRYLEQIKKQITPEENAEFWEWEKYHNLNKPSVLKITAIIRSGLFPLLALCSLIAHQLYPYPSARGFLWLPDDPLKIALLVVDCVLISLAVGTALGMAWRKVKRGIKYKESTSR